MKRWHRSLLVVLVCAATGTSQALFPIPETGFGQIIGRGDVDGDGDVDLIALTSLQGVSIFLNNGTGGFGPPVALTSNPGAALVADLTGDGVADIFVSTNGAFEVWTGLGGGVFNAVPIIVPVSGTVLQILLGEVNGDGIADVAVHWRNASGHRLEWFVASGATFTSWAVATSALIPQRVFAEDVTGNGLTDLLVSAGGWVDILLTAGNGVAWGPSWTYPGGILVDSRTEAVLMDFDGDGDRDLALVNGSAAGTTRIGILAHQGGTQWTVQPLQTIGTPLEGRHYAADWDGDGADDLWIVEGSFRTLLGNDGSGVFSVAYLLASSSSSPPSNRGPDAADLTGDGIVDLITSSDWLASHGTLVDPRQRIPAGLLQVLDWEGDGDQDLLSLNTLTVHHSMGNGVFTPGATFGPLPASAPGTLLTAIGAVDFDGDGDLDVIASFLSLTLVFPSFVEHQSFLNVGGGALVPVGRSTPASNQHMGFGPRLDWNGDGITDIAGAASIWLGDGLGHFSPVQPYIYPNALLYGVGDLDGDGAFDLLTSDGSWPALGLRIVFNHGGSTVLPGTYTTICMADLDGDGDPDVAGVRSPMDELVVFENDGTGTFVLHQTQMPSGVGTGSLTAGDFDGDGLVDLVAMNDTQTGRQILLRNGPWSFSASRHFAAYGAPGFVIDADGDGDSDLLVVDWWIPCLTFEPRRNGGLRRQYGAGSAGSGGITPALGATGPFRVGQSLNVLGRQGVGGAAAFLFVGGSETAAPVAGTPIIALVGPPQHFVLPLTLSGAAGVPGAGTLDLSMQIPASVSGLTIYLQLALGDAGAPVGITTSNGLELTFGF